MVCGWWRMSDTEGSSNWKCSIGGKSGSASPSSISDAQSHAASPWVVEKVAGDASPDVAKKAAWWRRETSTCPIDGYTYMVVYEERKGEREGGDHHGARQKEAVRTEVDYYLTKPFKSRGKVQSECAEAGL